MAKTPPRTPPTRRPVAAPATAPTTTAASLPLRAGVVYSQPADGGAPPAPSDDLMQQLRLIGVRDGEEPPPGIQEQITAVRQRFAGEHASAVQEVAAAGQRARVKLPPLTDLADLPPAAIKELTSFVEQHRTTGGPTPAPTPPPRMPPTNMHQSVGEMSNWLEQTYGTVTEQPPVEVVDGEAEDAAAPLPPSVGDPITPASTEAGAGQTSPHCPRCNWDRNIAFTVEPTEHDVDHFVAALLGLQRFTKEVPILNGQMVLVFRSLSTYESRAAITQCRRETLAGDIMNEAEYLMKLTDYRLLMSLAALRDKDGADIVTVPDLRSYEKSLPPEDLVKTPALVSLMEWFVTDGVTEESLRRVISHEHRQFQRLVETLEIRTADPSFCQRVGTRA